MSCVKPSRDPEKVYVSGVDGFNSIIISDAW